MSVVVGATIQAWMHKRNGFPASEQCLRFKLMILIPIQVQYVSSVVKMKKNDVNSENLSSKGGKICWNGSNIKHTGSSPSHLWLVNTRASSETGFLIYKLDERLVTSGLFSLRAMEDIIHCVTGWIIVTIQLKSVECPLTLLGRGKMSKSALVP